MIARPISVALQGLGIDPTPPPPAYLDPNASEWSSYPDAYARSEDALKSSNPYSPAYFNPQNKDYNSIDWKAAVPSFITAGSNLLNTIINAASGRPMTVQPTSPPPPPAKSYAWVWGLLAAGAGVGAIVYFAKK